MLAYPEWVHHALRDVPPLSRAFAGVTWPQAPAWSPEPHAGPPPPYRRAPLAHTANCEIVLIAWRQHRPTAIHDHAGASGRVFVLAGAVLEERWASSGALFSGTAPQRRELHTGQWLDLSAEQVHSMTAVGTAATWSLHLYLHSAAQNAEPMRLFDAQRSRLCQVPSHHGAFWPADDLTAERPEDERVHRSAVHRSAVHRSAVHRGAVHEGAVHEGAADVHALKRKAERHGGSTS